MDRRELRCRGQLHASTIMEVMVSMIIIIIVFGTAMMIYSNIVRSSLSAKKIQAQSILKEVLMKVEQGTETVNPVLTIGDLQIEREVKPYGTDGKLSEIHLTAYYDNHQKVAELQKVIINNNEEK